MIEELRQVWEQLPVLEGSIRDLLPWSTGNSRVVLWASALTLFALVIVIPTMIVGRVTEKLAKQFPPPSFQEED
jgi:hypothetical protein